MSKEMYISSSPHETKVAVLEDDQLVEVYFERDTDVGLVGGIYKGRVSRVLPGMQSAFVEIGLERDAFLYVSDFFYEDQEEYDKVFEEAEARATKFTTQQPEAPAPVPVATAPAEAVPPAVADAGAAAATPAAAPAPVEAPTAGPAPTGQTFAPPAPRDGRGDRRPFDRGRGRRRRHRGRHDFGDSRPGDRRARPPQRSDEPVSESHAFEVLPGESLAKYSHAAPPHGETTTEIHHSSVHEASAEATEIHDVEARPIETAGPAESNALISESGTLAEIVPPADETISDQVQPESPAAAEAHAEHAEASHEVSHSDAGHSDAVLPFTPRAIRSETPSAAPAPVHNDSIVGHHEAQAAGHPILESGPAPELPEPETEESVTMEFAEAEFVSDIGDPAAGEQVFAGEEEEEAEDSVEGGEEPLVADGPMPGEVISGAGSEGQPAATEAAAGGELAAATPGQGGDRTYTLREPHQRPRFAPRHRRGRRGQGGGVGPRHSFKPRESSRPGGNAHPVQISEVLKEGQEILVQIAKEPLGTKGARITSHVALPGRYLVFMPTIDHIGVSRKIASEEERLRLRNIILENRGALTGGFIVRTAGQGRSEEEFKADLKFLSTLWAEIRAKSERLKAPALIHRDLDLVQRLLRDLLTPDFKCVRVDSEVDYERVLDFVNRCQPALVGKVKLYTSDTPLYEEFGIQAELDKALKPKVWLKSGGYIVINQTEALVAVDVNTGKYVGKTNRLEDTIVKTNVDAVNEIVRQVRLRDLGGIIVIDFIDMDERRNRARVVQALEDALRGDRAPTKVISFHDFGLVAVTRKRVKQSLERTLCEPCEYCTGAGWVKSVNTVCNEILAEARKMAKGIDGKVLTLRVSPGVAKALKSRDGSLIAELELLTKKEIMIKTDPMIHQERFEIF